MYAFTLCWSKNFSRPFKSRLCSIGVDDGDCNDKLNQLISNNNIRTDLSKNFNFNVAIRSDEPCEDESVQLHLDDFFEKF